jgi:hypothetical protein
MPGTAIGRSCVIWSTGIWPVTVPVTVFPADAADWIFLVFLVFLAGRQAASVALAARAIAAARAG